MSKRRLEGLVNAIYHGVTNARAEGTNSCIEWIKYTARGVGNRERFRRAIHFHLGGLNMVSKKSPTHHFQHKLMKSLGARRSTA